MQIAKNTREQWLNQAAKLLAPHFKAAGFPLPEKIRMTCGFPSRGALASKKQSIGECWTAKASGDEHFEIFVSPLLDKSERVLDVLTHELAHSAVGIEHKHDRKFAKCVRALHLEGKPTATVGGKDFLDKIAKPIIAELGKYPHAKLIASANPKKQTTRLIKCACPICEYTIRITRKWLDEAGAPDCPSCEQTLEEAGSPDCPSCEQTLEEAGSPDCPSCEQTLEEAGS